jgi:hypothetical protein
MLAARSHSATSSQLADEPNVETTSCQHAPAHAESHFELAAPTHRAMDAAAHAPVHAPNASRGRVTPAASGDYDVRLTITPEEHEVLRRALDLLGHSVPSGDPALVYARAMRHYLAHLEKQRLGPGPRRRWRRAAATAASRRRCAASSGSATAGAAAS